MHQRRHILFRVGSISRVRFQEAIKILTGSTKYQGICGYFCDIFFKYCYHNSHLRTLTPQQNRSLFISPLPQLDYKFKMDSCEVI